VELNDDEVDYILGCISYSEGCDNPPEYERAIASLKERLSDYQFSEESKRYIRK
jgi:hypothetical protein